MKHNCNATWYVRMLSWLLCKAKEKERAASLRAARKNIRPVHHPGIDVRFRRLL